MLGRSEKKLENGASDSSLAQDLQSLSTLMSEPVEDPLTAKRQAALSQTLQGIAARLR